MFSKALMSPTLFKNPEIIIHTFGHKFPTLGIRETAIVIRFLKKHGGGRRGI